MRISPKVCRRESDEYKIPPVNVLDAAPSKPRAPRDPTGIPTAQDNTCPGHSRLNHPTPAIPLSLEH
ncbi:uncharacterized protein PGTG_21078 [Puccinia graminis f. sp. tritici CRL 75-36-700-3]|uniref:Uncharacterized protein n=1 Tax=Puccinia graminis f. sp. tritici (strain CRL 75-36-700-3 / race SCCL) TaxID=418459 RepID=H6QQB8_PUCGT|nr:uncharacterized protein PGTG_21078 [Puccinia graminis f. sp. tritici CRL 75-36-700-3]EHS64820.1 hypothetical protein PGTG_21078 [Puccinia graminis f. sp. tritici CRL 75-36-700-3]